MSIELNRNMNIVVKVRLVARGDDKPLSGSDYSVRLYDQDVFNDDFLGESGVEDGEAVFQITQDNFSSPLNVDEKPDFYFVVYHKGHQIFTSKVLEDVDVSDVAKFVMSKGEVIDLGTYLIDANA